MRDLLNSKRMCAMCGNSAIGFLDKVNIPAATTNIKKYNLRNNNQWSSVPPENEKTIAAFPRLPVVHRTPYILTSVCPLNPYLIRTLLHASFVRDKINVRFAISGQTGKD